MWSVWLQSARRETIMKQFTDITVVLDRSGSMTSCKEAMERAFDSFIEGHKAIASTRISLVQFDTVNPYELVYQSVPVQSVEKLNLQPRGGTPLLDALCNTIDRTGQRYSSMREADRPDQVLILVITDGQENASKSFSKADVRNRINIQHNTYRWEFVYLGANHDAFDEASKFGFDINKIMWYDVNRLDPAVYNLMSNTVSYAASVGNERGTVTASAKLDFSDDQLKSSTEDWETVKKAKRKVTKS